MSNITDGSQTTIQQLLKLNFIFDTPAFMDSLFVFDPALRPECEASSLPFVLSFLDHLWCVWDVTLGEFELG